MATGERDEVAANLDEVADRGGTIARHLASAVEQLRHVNPVRISGRVTDVIGLVIEGTGPGLPIGGVCQIERRDGGESIAAEVVGFRQNRVLLMPLGEVSGIEPGNRIVVARDRPTIGVGPTLRPMLEDVKEMELVEDASLAENGCILESQFGDLDLGIDSQIGAIRAALTQGV